MKTEPYSRKSLFLVAGITAICLLPFINKAFHIDDSLFLWSAKQIQAHPFDFYGFLVNWYGRQDSMYLINQNPPLVSYFIAVIAFFWGWSEIALHLAFLVVGVCLSIGIYFLARFFCQKSYLAALIAVLTPVFLVSSTNIMTDILMLTFYVWSAVLWLLGMEKDKSLYLLCSVILISLSALTKYYGMSIIPLLFIYSLLARRKLGIWTVYLIIPILVIVEYQLVTYLLYNNFLISNAAIYAIQIGGGKNISMFIAKTFTGLSYTGGCIIGVLFFSHLIWSRRALICGFIFLILFIAILFGIEPIRTILLPNIKHLNFMFILQYSLFVFTGIQILLLAIIDIIKNRSPKSSLLFLWIFGTFIFAAYINWTISARTILPMIPAVGILIARRLNFKIDDKKNTKMLIYTWPLIPAAIIALSVTWADVSLANCQRIAAYNIHNKFNDYPHTIWFQGHWGFQYYMESLGAKSLEYNKSIIKTGDIIIQPINNTNLVQLPKKQFHYINRQLLMPCRYIGTMSEKYPAGFYTAAGPLPFFIGKAASEEYLIFLAGNFKNSYEAVQYFRKHIRPQVSKKNTN